MSLDVPSIYSFMQAFRNTVSDYYRRVGESYPLPSLSAFVLSVTLHGVIFASVFFAMGDWGKSDVTLPEMREVIDVEIVEVLPAPKEEVQKPDPVPKIIKKSIPKKKLQPAKKEEVVPSAPVVKSNIAPVKKETAQAQVRSQSETTPQFGQRPSVARGHFSRESYAQKLTQHITAHKYYPKSARQRRIEGKVVVSFTIGAQGNISNAQIVKSSKNHLLDSAALKTLKRAQPFPLTTGGTGQRNMTFKLPVNYSLKN